MNTLPGTNLHKRHRLPAEIVSQCVWLYFRFFLGYRGDKELMAMRGVASTYETARSWCRKCGQEYAKLRMDRLRNTSARDAPGFPSPDAVKTWSKDSTLGRQSRASPPPHKRDDPESHAPSCMLILSTDNKLTTTVFQLWSVLEHYRLMGQREEVCDRT